ncbi:MAG: peptidylprolyl isomerase [Balneolales bacterium]
MHQLLKFFTISIILLLSSFTVKAQQSEIVDQIVAVVNDHIILKSEVDQRVAEYVQGNNMDNFQEDLWYQVLESLIDNYVLVEKATIDSVVVADDEVNRILDQRINQLVQRAGSEQELEEAFGSSILEIKAEYRDVFREDMLVERVRQNRIGTINITRPEVVEFFESIPQDSLPLIPESVSLSQIVVIPPPKSDATQSALQLAEQLRDSILNHGKDLEELARRHSDGPTASGGGRLPMVPTSDLVTEYAAAASALEPGEISEVVETSQGYHIIRLNERSGDNISTHHILIQVKDDQLDEEFAIQRLEALRDSVVNHGKSFSAMARSHSQDKITAPTGGRLIDPQSGQQRIEVNRLDPSLRSIVRQLRTEGEGAISEPQAFQTENNSRAYRIVQLREFVSEHIANIDTDYEMIKNFAMQQKQQLELMSWMNKVRDEVYVEYKIPMSDVDRLTPNIPVDQENQGGQQTAPQPEQTY